MVLQPLGGGLCSSLSWCLIIFHTTEHDCLIGHANLYLCHTAHWGLRKNNGGQLAADNIFVCNLTHWPLGDFNKILEKIIFTPILVTDGCDISSEIALRWTSLDLNDDKSTLVQVMAWCHQATSHYLGQCWPKSLPPYGITRPQWVNIDVCSLWCNWQ